MPQRVLIIEDEAPAYRRLNGLLQEHHPEFEVLEVIDAISEAVRWFDHHKAPDLIFSDIQLSDGLSFEIFKQVRIPCPIIFTTAYDEYMLEAFRTNGIDYLLKPIEAQDLLRGVAKFKALTANKQSELPDLSQLIERITQRTPKYKERFLVKVGVKLLPLLASDIAYFTSSDGITELTTREGRRYPIDQPLDELEELLDPSAFYRLNRATIASVVAISVVHQHFQGKLKVILSPASPTEAMVSREKARSFKEWMGGVRSEE
ncbi:MAG: response regulator transcription factor [Flavobacteriales bacterium]|nr:response regulator transcription factor [Flavobacteriales bacterium]